MKKIKLNIRKYIILGILTIIPIWITYLVLEFVLNIFVKTARPLVDLIFKVFESHGPHITGFLDRPWIESIFAVTLMLFILYVLGWFANRWLGRKIISVFDVIMDRIPLAKSIYKSVKRLTEAMQTKPEDVDRVVLINFPSSDMKTVGLVTRTFKDDDTGKELAAIYVPTTPNPSSGYLEIVPMDKVTKTSWTMDEAMSFVISGGASLPDTMNYEKGVTTPKKEDYK